MIGIVLSAGLLMVSACTGSDAAGKSGSLKGLENEASIVNPDASAESTWVYGSLPVCVVTGGPATLTALRLESTGGVELVAAGIRASSDGGTAIADAAGPLPAAYTRIPGASVTGACDAGPVTELAFEVKPSLAASARIRCVELAYRDGTGTHTLRYPFTVVLCSSPKVTDLPECSSG